MLPLKESRVQFNAIHLDLQFDKPHTEDIEDVQFTAWNLTIYTGLNRL